MGGVKGYSLLTLVFRVLREPGHRKSLSRDFVEHLMSDQGDLIGGSPIRRVSVSTLSLQPRQMRQATTKVHRFRRATARGMRSAGTP